MSPLLSNETWTYVQYGTFTLKLNLKPMVPLLSNKIWNQSKNLYFQTKFETYQIPLLSNKTWNVSNTFTF